MITSLLDLSHTNPAEDFGMPGKFTKLREIQQEVVNFALYGGGGGGMDDPDLGPRRFHAAGAPGGVGKSLASHMAGRLSGGKYVALTATKSLQEQEVDDGFPVVDVRGKSNYNCIDYDPLHPDQRWSCEEGSDEKDCRYAGTYQCTHSIRIEEARRSPAVLSNYHAWMHARKYNRTAWEGGTKARPEPIELLICDEFHKAMGALAGFLNVWVSNEMLHKHANEPVRNLIRESKGQDWGRVGSRWVEVLTQVWMGVAGQMGKLLGDYQTEQEARRKSGAYRKLERLCENLDRIVSLGEDGNWIWRHSRNGIAFDCIWPKKYAERFLWSGVKRVVLLSATLRPYTMRLMGIKNSESWFHEWRDPFPAHLSPVYWVPTGKMGRHEGPEAMERSVARTDEMADIWAPNHKGIIHTHSYERAEEVRAKSKWGKWMIVNKDANDIHTAEDKYRNARPPAILVSPSFSTGFDFPDSACDWQVINKLPFPKRNDPVVMARMESDDQYYNHETMQTFVQATKRGTRHERDGCVTIVTDDAVGNFRKYAREYAPKSFKVLDAPGGRVPGVPEWMRK